MNTQTFAHEPFYQIMNFSISKFTTRTYVLLLVTFALGIYLIFHLFFSSYKPDTSTVWKLIPNESIAVVELHQPKQILDAVCTTSAWEQLAALPYLQQAEEQLVFIDSLSNKHPFFHRLTNDPIWLSLHSISRNELGFMVYIPIEQEPASMDSLMEQLGYASQFSHTTRTYHDHTIQEITDFETNQAYSFIFFEGYLIGSATAWLVEDVLRHGELGFFAQKDWKRLKNTFNRKKLAQHPAHIYFNHKQLPVLAKTLWDYPLHEKGNWLSKLTDATVWGLALNEQDIRLTGKTAYKMHDEYRLFSLFERVAAPESDLALLIPNQTAYLYRLGFGDGEAFFNELYHDEDNQETFIQDIWELYDFDVQELWEHIQGELAVAVFPANDANKPQEQLLFIQVKDTAEVSNLLRQLIPTETNSKQVATEVYSHHLIGKLPIQNFPNYAFGDFYEGFEQSYFLLVNDYLVIGNTKQIMMRLLQSIGTNEVWASRSDYEHLAPVFSSQSHIGLAVNFPRTWSIAKRPLAKDWRDVFHKQQRHLWRLGTGNLTFNVNTGQANGSLIIRDLNAMTDELLAEHDLQYNSTLPVASKTKPTWVLNHQDSSSELFFQDRWNRINLISNTGKRLWSVQIGQPVSSDVAQIDLFKNQKLQYVFTAGDQVFAYDRLGRPVNGFPLRSPNPIETFSVLDYDKNQQYFFAISDVFGQVFMFNKYGKLRFGWQPKRLSGELASPMQHFKIGEEDYLIATQKNGLLFVLNKSGGAITGFPLNLREDINGFSISQGSQLATSYIQLLSVKGFVITVNFLGKVVERRPLALSQSNAIFLQCEDETGSNALIYAQQKSQKVSFFTAYGELLFSHDYGSSTDKIVQYYHFSREIQLIVVTDQRNKRSYIHYLNGELIHDAPYKSEQAVSIHYDSNTQAYYLGRCYGKQVEMSKLPLQ